MSLEEQEVVSEAVSEQEEIAPFESSTAPEAGELEPAPLEAPEETAQAARDAGLVAARELSESPAFDRWKAGALSGDGAGGFDSEDRRRVSWLRSPPKPPTSTPTGSPAGSTAI